MKSSIEDLYIYTAKLGKTVGLHGLLRVYSISGEYDHLLSLQRIKLQLVHSQSLHVCDVLAWKKMQSKLLVQLKGITSPEQTRALVNAKVMVLRDQAAKLKPGEMYIRDMINCPVYHNEERYGVVTAVYDLGAYDCLEVRKNSEKLCMIPIQDVFVESMQKDKIILCDHELFK